MAERQAQIDPVEHSVNLGRERSAVGVSDQRIRLSYPSGGAPEALYRKHSERCHIDNGNRKPIGSRSVLTLPNRISTTGCRRQIAAPPRQNGPPPRKDRKPEAASRLTGTGIPGRSTPADSSRARSRRQIRPNPARNSDVGKSCVSIFREDRQVKNSTLWPTPGQYCIIFASGQITKQKFI